jgi:hypothetical protein
MVMGTGSHAKTCAHGAADMWVNYWPLHAVCKYCAAKRDIEATMTTKGYVRFNMNIILKSINRYYSLTENKKCTLCIRDKKLI